uniref:AB hydrolase-1 domain-containing protein n=1 Tax=Xiphophorus couchianus TaxID=32473 RepID=A0A3B5LAZ3_9TELE
FSAGEVVFYKPQDVLNHTCNFYLSPEEGVSVGVWHTLPASQWEAAAGRNLDWYQEALGDGRPVIIYLHGNVGTRWVKCRRIRILETILLDAAGYHVLSLDYRGFGDSSGEPSEAGLTNDALYLHQWAKARSRGIICLWGHSLGSGVATNAAVKIQEQGGFELRFSLKQNQIENILGCLFFFFALIISDICCRFCSLQTLSSPLLILHAEDDKVVPFHMGQKLYQISLRAQRESETGDRVQMISYGANLGLSHSRICSARDLAGVVQ